MNIRNLVLILILIGTLIAAGYFIFGRRPAAESPEVLPEETEDLTSSPSGDEEEQIPPTAEAETREITLKGTEFGFNPAMITVSTGEKLKITFRNDGKFNHDFQIPELGVKTNTIGPGQAETIEVLTQEPGSYTFLCSLPGHRDAGMEGLLKVE